jgi:hypothetical protein
MEVKYRTIKKKQRGRGKAPDDDACSNFQKNKNLALLCLCNFINLTSRKKKIKKKIVGWFQTSLIGQR